MMKTLSRPLEDQIRRH